MATNKAHSRGTPTTSDAQAVGCITLRDVEKVFVLPEKDVIAVHDITMHVGQGEIVTVLGPSGCGKSTILRMIAGLESPTSGSISVDGHEVTGPIRDVGIVFQSPLLLEWRNALDNVLLQIEMRKLAVSPYRDRALQLLSLIGLGGFEDVHPAELSGGMQQRVSICRALIHDPSVLLMDEPFGALDAQTRDELNEELLLLCRDQKKTVLFITHSISEAIYLGDRVYVMSPGPGTVAEEIAIGLPRNRTIHMQDTPEFVEYMRRARQALESQDADARVHSRRNGRIGSISQ